MSALSDEYDLHDDQPTGFGRLIFPALVISFLLHVIFFMWARDYPVDPFSDAYYDRFVPRTFRLERVEIDPEVLEEPELAQEQKQAAAPTAVRPPEDTISFEAQMGNIKATPAVPELNNSMLADTPDVKDTTLASTVETALSSGAQSVAKDLDSIREELIMDNPEISGRPLLEMAAETASTGTFNVPEGRLAGADTPGFSNLDDLLAATGPLTSETAPILMPADLLFDYDSYTLQEASLSSLEKLGTLIRGNPQVDFVIEGHTDSFGSSAYNLQLSSMRAETVKAWLVYQMGIDPAQIRTEGYGSTRLIAPGDGSIEEQQINRRVEIVIRSRGGQ